MIELLYPYRLLSHPHPVLVIDLTGKAIELFLDIEQTGDSSLFGISRAFPFFRFVEKTLR